MVDGAHHMNGVDACRDLADLDTVVFEVDRQGDRSTVFDRRRGRGDRLGSDQVEGSDPIVVAPAASVPDLGGDFVEESVERHGPERKPAQRRPAASNPY
jgi:hypothetical protein